MTRCVEFFFDVGSPAAYLAWSQVPTMCQRLEAELSLTPMLLGGVFNATGNRPPGAVPAKGKYLLRDLGRFAERYQTPFNFNPHFPVNTLLPMRILAAAQGSEQEHQLVQVLFDAMWKTPCKISEPDVVEGVLSAANLDAGYWLAQAADDTVKARLKENTERAVGRGVFGAPTLFVGEEMFFGQDRLDFVEAALVSAS